MSETTSRLELPLLVAGQGQKDITHNEALVALDALLHARVVSREISVPPSAPAAGDCWLVAAGASGAWAGGDGRLACWTAGGWRLLALPEGASLWVSDEAARVRKVSSGWAVEAPIGAPVDAVASAVGGVVVDEEARAVLHSLLERLQQLGLILP